MSETEFEAAIAAFIRNKGVTRCPTVCLVPTQGTTSIADREALRQRAAARDDRCRQRLIERWKRTFGVMHDMVPPSLVTAFQSSAI